jgi:hypothetical protein
VNSPAGMGGLMVPAGGSTPTLLLALWELLRDMRNPSSGDDWGPCGCGPIMSYKGWTAADRSGIGIQSRSQVHQLYHSCWKRSWTGLLWSLTQTLPHGLVSIYSSFIENPWLNQFPSNEGDQGDFGEEPPI